MLFYIEDAARNLFVLLVCQTIDWDVTCTVIEMPPIGSYLYYNWDNFIVTELSTATVHARTIPAVNTMYLPVDICAIFSECEACGTAFRQIILDDEAIVAHYDLGHRMEAESGNVPPLLVDDAFD